MSDSTARGGNPGGASRTQRRVAAHAAPPSLRAGFSLVELIVALALLSVAMIALAGTAAVAQRFFADAAAMDRGVRAAAEVIDSLGHVPAPVSGRRTIDGVRVEWNVGQDEQILRIDVTAADERTGAAITFSGARPAPPAAAATP
jgi:prepilin-type N-terminal cleavage/methylation domain-containing protein